MQNRWLAEIGVIWLAPLLVLGPALSCVAPKAMAALFIATGVFAIAGDCMMRRKLPDVDWRLAASLGAIVVYGAVSQIWTISPEDTLMKAGQLGLVFGLTSMLVPIVARLDERHIERFGNLILVGLGLGLAVYGIEQAFGFPLFNLANPGKANAVADLKQSKAIVLLALWFYLAVPRLLGRPDVRLRGAMVAVAILLTFFTFTSLSMSAQLFLVVAALWALIVWLAPSRVTLPLATTGIVGFTALMPALVQNLERVMDWRHASYLFNSVLSRIEMWYQATDRITEKPLLGWGLDSFPDLPNRGEMSIFNTDPPLPIAHLHPHNAPIQLWFELGGIGIAFASVMFLLLHIRISAVTNERAKRFAIFLLPSTFAYTLTIWGIWQTWFVATLCFVGVAGYAGMRFLENEQR